MARILVTGALGQIGSELVPALRQRYGVDNVIATDLKVLQPSGAAALAPYDHLDCTEPNQLHEAVRRYDVGSDLSSRRAALGIRRSRAAARVERQHERSL